MLGVIGPMTLLGLSFAVLVAPLAASVMSSVDQADEGLASGVNHAASRVAQLAGVALAAGVASFASGYEIRLAVAAVASIGGAFTAAELQTSQDGSYYRYRAFLPVISTEVNFGLVRLLVHVSRLHHNYRNRHLQRNQRGCPADTDFSDRISAYGRADTLDSCGNRHVAFSRNIRLWY